MNPVLALTLLAVLNTHTWTLGGIAKAVILIAALVAIVYLALTWFEISIPPPLIKMFWVCVVAFVALVAVEFLLSL